MPLKNKPATMEDIEKFLDWMGVVAPEWQKKAILRYINLPDYEKKLMMMPPQRSDGHSLTKLRLHMWCLGIGFDEFEKGE